MTSQHIPAPITREAQVDPQVRRTAESIVKIINFLMFRVPDKDKKRFMGRIRGKIQRLPAGQVGLKQMPPTATIGQAVSLTKNILAGLNPFFVKQVIDEVGRVLERVRDVQQPTPVPLKPKGLAPFGPKRAFLDVVIQPLDPAVHRAVQQIKAKHPGLLKQVERIVVHPGGGGGHLGHVESGPDKNPREIHLFKGVIEQQLRKRMPGGRAAPKEWDDALEHAIVEVIGHEAGHIGLHERTPEQMRSQPFHGEGEAETRARETLQRVYPGRAAKKAHYSPMQSPWDYDIAAEQEDGLPWSGNMSEFLERFPGGLREWKAWRQSKLFKGHFDLKDGVQSNPSRPVKILPAPGFGKAAALRAPLSAMRCLGVLESLLGCPPHSEDFPAALAAWQEKAGGRPSGKLDRPTLARLRARIPEGRGLPRNFGIVSLDPLVCRGGMPDSRDELEALKKMGVERIVSLDDSIPDIAAWCGDLGLEHVDAPLAHGSPGDRGWEVLGPSIDGFLSEGRTGPAASSGASGPNAGGPATWHTRRPSPTASRTSSWTCWTASWTPAPAKPPISILRSRRS